MLTELGEDNTIELLSSFSCPQNLDVQSFLTQATKAIRFETTGNARTYLILDGTSGAILAYFSVSFKELLLRDTTLSKSQVKKLDGISKNAEQIRAFLIGQVGKNASIEDNPLNLASILDEIYAVIAAARQLIGGRVIILECENSPKLIQLYQEHGFTLIETTDDDTTELRTLYTHVTE